MKKYSIDKLRQAWGAGMSMGSKSAGYSKKEMDAIFKAFVNAFVEIIIEETDRATEEARDTRHALFGLLEEMGEKKPEKRARELAEDFRERIGLPRKLKNS